MHKTVLLISDDPLIRRVASLLLGEAGLNVVVESSHRAVEKSRQNGFALYVIYANDCKKDCLEMCRAIRREVINPVLLVGAQMPESYVLEAYEAGVDEFIPMPISPALFLAKARAWLRRAWTVPAGALETVQVGLYSLNPEPREFKGSGATPVSLTNLEFRVLYLLMTHAGRPLSTDFIIERIWLEGEGGDTGSLKNVIYRLRGKLKAQGERPGLIETVPNVGYVFAVEPSARGE